MTFLLKELVNEIEVTDEIIRQVLHLDPPYRVMVVSLFSSGVIFVPMSSFHLLLFVRIIDQQVLCNFIIHHTPRGYLGVLCSGFSKLVTYHLTSLSASE